MISMIIHTYTYMEQHCDKNIFGDICGSTVLGVRGQVVLPKEARERIKAKTGDRFITVYHNGVIVLVPENILSKMIKSITKFIKIK